MDRAYVDWRRLYAIEQARALFVVRALPTPCRGQLGATYDRDFQPYPEESEPLHFAPRKPTNAKKLDPMNPRRLSLLFACTLATMASSLAQTNAPVIFPNEDAQSPAEYRLV